MMSLVGKNAPAFEAPAVINGKDILENFSMEQYIGEKYIIFFFYPADFTFVCPTEILAFQKKLAEFEKREAVVIGCSVDSHFSHWKWLQTEKNDGGIKGVTYPLVADQTQTISENYGVLAGNYGYTDDGEAVFQGSPVAYRATFIIDKKGLVRHEVVNDMGIGRSIEETIRTLDSLIYFEKHGEVCPANWKQGDEAMKPTFNGVAEYLSKH
ncbi:MAG: peroxiredoxin [Bacteroidales bacterium]|nr:peroxiredoxin [Bacteroidales bacterium]